MSNGEKVWIEGIKGTASVYNGFRTVANVTADTFTGGVDTTGKSWTSGGTIARGGKIAAQGGGWYGAGDTGNFVVNATNHNAERTEVSDADLNTGRYAFLPEPGELTAVQVAAQVATVNTGSATKLRIGVLARYTNVENWVMAVLALPITATQYNLQVLKRVGGVVTTLGEKFVLFGGTGSLPATTVQLLVTANGTWQAIAGGAEVTGQDAALATGGTLATGRAGIYDAWTSASASTRTFDNLTVFSGAAADAAIFASRKAEVRWDRMQREDSGGTLLVPRSDYKGSYFRPQPARREARSQRTIVKLSRYNIDTMQDVAIDDAAFRIFWQARGLVLPES
jgi:hypothetical protein